MTIYSPVNKNECKKREPVLTELSRGVLGSLYLPLGKIRVHIYLSPFHGEKSPEEYSCKGYNIKSIA